MRDEQPACPICGKPASARFSPFCSRRCAEVDLGQWLLGEYRIPAAADVPEDAAAADPGGPA